MWLVDNTVIGRQNIPHNRSIFGGVLNSGPIHSSPSLGINTIYIPIHQAPTTAVTWLRSRSRPETSRQEARSFNRKSLFIFPNYRWLLNWTPKTQPPSTPVGNCHPSKKYVRSLRERHRRSGGEQTPHPSVEDVVIIQDESRNRRSWKLGIVDELIVGRDGIIRAAKMRAGKGVMERAVQHLHPLELSVDRKPMASSSLNPVAPAFRPTRATAATANELIQEIARAEESSDI